MQQFVQDYDERMPGHSDNTNRIIWTEQIYPYVKNPQVFGCPSAAVNGPSIEDQIDNNYNYAWNYYGDSSQKWMKIACINRPAEALVILDCAYYLSNP